MTPLFVFARNISKANDTILVLFKMKLITRDVDYAIRILMYLAKDKKKHRAFDSVEITKELKIPKPFARKILRILSKNKILRSRKGKEGGFRYNSKIKKISIVDLIKIFKGKTEINKCIFKSKICPNRNMCPLRNEITQIEQHVLKKLKQVTINSLIKQYGKEYPQ